MPLVDASTATIIGKSRLRWTRICARKGMLQALEGVAGIGIIGQRLRFEIRNEINAASIMNLKNWFDELMKLLEKLEKPRKH